MGLTEMMPKAVRRADATRYQKYLRVVKLERELKRKILEDPGPEPVIPELVLRPNLTESQPQNRCGSFEFCKAPDCGACRPGQEEDPIGTMLRNREGKSPPRSQVLATAAATPKEAGIAGARQQEAAWYQGERVSYQQALQNGQDWGEQQGAEVRQLRQVLELREVKVSGVQDLLAMTRREVGEIRKTVWRLEREKEELGEQISEMRKSIDELCSFQDRR